MAPSYPPRPLSRRKGGTGRGVSSPAMQLSRKGGTGSRRVHGGESHLSMIPLVPFAGWKGHTVRVQGGEIHFIDGFSSRLLRDRKGEQAGERARPRCRGVGDGEQQVGESMAANFICRRFRSCLFRVGKGTRQLAGSRWRNSFIEGFFSQQHRTIDRSITNQRLITCWKYSRIRQCGIGIGNGPCRRLECGWRMRSWDGTG